MNFCQQKIKKNQKSDSSGVSNLIVYVQNADFLKKQIFFPAFISRSSEMLKFFKGRTFWDML